MAQDFGADEPRGWSPLAVALIATLVLLLGLGGALFGIRVANSNAEAARTPSTTPPPGGTTAPTTPPAGPTTPAGGTTAPDSFDLPDLAGTDFQVARQRVRELKLGWSLVFEGDGDDPTVRATDPPAGTDVKRGVTVKIFVRGFAPVATLSAVVGQPCGEAADAVVEAGLYPQYPSGRSGSVNTIEPLPSEPPTLRWNDKVNLYCG